jgi:hypothetical protein
LSRSPNTGGIEEEGQKPRGDVVIIAGARLTARSVPVQSTRRDGFIPTARRLPE